MRILFKKHKKREDVVVKNVLNCDFPHKILLQMIIKYVFVLFNQLFVTFIQILTLKEGFSSKEWALSQKTH